MKIKIVLRKGVDGFIVANCPSLKGCWTQGKTTEEVLKNIRNAIALYLEPSPKDIRPSRTRRICELTV